MKNKKSIYKLFLLLAVVFVVSCDDSDDVNDVVSGIDSGLDVSNDLFFNNDTASANIFTGTDIPNDLTVGTLTALSADTNVVFDVMYQDGTTATEGVDYMVNDGVITSGSQDGTGSITFLNLGDFEVSIAGNDGSSLDNTPSKLIFKVVPTVTFSMVWDDPFYDYDMFYMDGIDLTMNDVYTNGTSPDLNALGYSGGISNFESVTILSTDLVGDTYLYLEDFYNDNASVDVTLTVAVQGGTSTDFTIVMDMDKWAFKVQGTQTDSGVTFVYEVL
ncbi:hypothetical protein FG167_07015 [Lacinutrix sp. WUR7]|uniref:hypothetical protein n=1 Tax=Lacinutrix sp. WUR7 TaxID=2653681 RepID=UPI00193E33B5|nr:hypothetical protein [Lacinutrix sp. WUR7]QRM88995.1 hypothetical protein FG167_07015 [Lacinutrix sp. WUR7]